MADGLECCSRLTDCKTKPSVKQSITDEEERGHLVVGCSEEEKICLEGRVSDKEVC